MVVGAKHRKVIMLNCSKKVWSESFDGLSQSVCHIFLNEPIKIKVREKEVGEKKECLHEGNKSTLPKTKSFRVKNKGYNFLRNFIISS